MWPILHWHLWKKLSGFISEGQRNLFMYSVTFPVRKMRQKDEENGKEREGWDSLLEIVLQRAEINS